MTFPSSTYILHMMHRAEMLLAGVIAGGKL